MTTIAQVDQLITSLQNIRAEIAEDNGKFHSGDFDAMFDTALSEALEEPTSSYPQSCLTVFLQWIV